MAFEDYIEKLFVNGFIKKGEEIEVIPVGCGEDNEGNTTYNGEAQEVIEGTLYLDQEEQVVLINLRNVESIVILKETDKEE